MKHLFLSPSFGAFRAYEPLAFKVAKELAARKGTSTFDKVETIRDGHRLEIIGYGETVEVFLDDDETPFVFDVVGV
jgi:hypothetical protein